MVENILTIREVADLLKINEKTVYKLAADAKIPGFKVGGSWRFDRATITRWIEKGMNRAGIASVKKGFSTLEIATAVPISIYMDGERMVNSKTRPSEKVGDTEKITLNLGYVDLGRIDLLVSEGFFSNRSDFIRTAIRNQLANHSDAVKQSVIRRTLEMGLRRYSRRDLEAVKAAGEKLRIQILGLATIDDDVSPDLALATIESVTVLGALQASSAVKAALADRIE